MRCGVTLEALEPSAVTAQNSYAMCGALTNNSALYSAGMDIGNAATLMGSGSIHQDTHGTQNHRDVELLRVWRC